jgi:hypothetical protein
MILRELISKIDLRLLPLMATMYFMQQLDKSAVSFAAVFNIQKDAHLVWVECNILYFSSSYPQGNAVRLVNHDRLRGEYHWATR